MNKERVSDVVRYCHGRKEDMLGFLQTLVGMESPSHVPNAQDVILDLLESRLKALGHRVLRVPGQETGGYLVSHPVRRRGGEPLQLLIGHCDTVWPLGTVDEKGVTMSDGQMRGPGVYDMKAGLTQIIFALQAMRDLGMQPSATPVVLINSDEETGSRESERAIRCLARIAHRAYVMEPPLGLDGKLKTARKGLGRFTITVTGQPAHAGLDPGKGASAILELSHQIQQLFGMNDHDRGISVNVGMIEGGISPNVVAPQSKAVVDVRVPTWQDAEEIERLINALRPLDEDTVIHVEGEFGRPPMEPTSRNEALWEAARKAGRQIDLDLDKATAGGGSDGNITSQYCATLDGLGTVGDGAHASHEFIYIDTLIERTALLVLLIMLPPSSQLKEP